MNMNMSMNMSMNMNMNMLILLVAVLLVMFVMNEAQLQRVKLCRKGDPNDCHYRMVTFENGKVKNGLPQGLKLTGGNSGSFKSKRRAVQYKKMRAAAFIERDQETRFRGPSGVYCSEERNACIDVYSFESFIKNQSWLIGVSKMHASGHRDFKYDMSKYPSKGVYTIPVEGNKTRFLVTSHNNTDFMYEINQEITLKGDSRRTSVWDFFSKQPVMTLPNPEVSNNNNNNTINNSSSVEGPPTSYVVTTWKKKYLSRKVLEVAVIYKGTYESKLDSQAMINEAFTDNASRPPVYYWPGIFMVKSNTNEFPPCGPVEIMDVDPSHDASKLMGITMAHSKIWKEFLRRNDYEKYGFSELGANRLVVEGYVIILESDIHCAYFKCGDIAAMQLEGRTEDVVFLGWCLYGYQDFGPPLCLHAYAVSLNGARVLSNYADFECVRSVDHLVRHAGNVDVLSWGVADIGKRDVYVNMSTIGLWNQSKW